jgi:hypothetical protein
MNAQFARVVVIFLSIWLISSVAFSNGSIAPEITILSQAKSTAEYPVLRRIQDLTLELQLLEITIKNRRDSQVEEKISAALKEVEADGQDLAVRFHLMREKQLEKIYALLTTARRYGELTGVHSKEWDDVFKALANGELKTGTILVHGKYGTLDVLTLSPLFIGRQFIWQVNLPKYDRGSFWYQARARAQHFGVYGKDAYPKIGKALLEEQVAALNEPYRQAQTFAKNYFATSYSKLYGAFESHRYAILQRITLARKALVELSRMNSAMGTPEQYSTLYNRTLESLFSYGIDLSLSGLQRDFEIKGFLFAETPERSAELLTKLKYSPTNATYNSPSS